jgi:hypothetical protein
MCVFRKPGKIHSILVATNIDHPTQCKMLPILTQRLQTPPASNHLKFLTIVATVIISTTY